MQDGIQNSVDGCHSSEHEWMSPQMCDCCTRGVSLFIYTSLYTGKVRLLELLWVVSLESVVYGTHILHRENTVEHSNEERRRWGPPPTSNA